MGRLFREFAVTLAVAITMSALVSLTVTPMMAARLLVSTHERRESWLARQIGAVLPGGWPAATTGASGRCLPTPG